MQLIVVRHGQTDANAAKILQGSRLDQPLNDIGKQQAIEAAIQLANTSIDVLYSSQLRRAKETAEAIANQLNLTVIQNELLNETDFGGFTSKTWKQAQEESGNERLKEIDRAHKYDYRSHGGESVEQVQRRIDQFLQHVKDHHQNQTVVAVTHGGIVRLLHYILEVEQPPHVENASIHRFEL